ncbi:ABC transporter ATP-binding protein [Natrinema sp. H-ect4]|uniref:ABC transporter ATP-binding protein n=1 Tax=Natrinema sp. H-ect4 TaxID=3242699 RepID=UPI0035A8B813
MTNSEDLSWREKIDALTRVAKYRPVFTFGLIILGGFVAFFQGVGLGFIYPIIEVAQTEGPVTGEGRVMNAFISFYEFFDIPFTLGNLIVGVAIVMTFRYAMSFLAAWLKALLSYQYEETLRTRAFKRALHAEIGYFDEEGSDDVLNAIITETRYSGQVIRKGVELMETLFLIAMYFVVMLYITPTMTALALTVLGGITVLLRVVVEPAVTVGSRVAEANEQVQRSVQAGTQGIRDVKLFGLGEEVFTTFLNSVEQYTTSSIDLSRNEAAIENFYRLSAAMTIFVLIYIGFVFSGLSLGELGIFLIAMFQLAPEVSKLNSRLYQVEGQISHLVRTQTFLDELEMQQEDGGERPISTVQRVEFEGVAFSYDDDENVLEDISFAVEKGEFVAFVGQSGAGKSTIVSLLTRMYDPDQGEIQADGVPLEEYNLHQWRERIAVVQQKPFIFNDTLENNISVAKRDATREDVERVSEIAKVNEFLDELPSGYKSKLGDDGVRLSGGQRQRVALARALLKDADFLVLDEATSDLDSSLEREVQDAIESMDRNYGIIAIAHRLSTVKNADQIYTIDDGKIIERGSHRELLADEGEYAELYAIQSRS